VIHLSDSPFTLVQAAAAATAYAVVGVGANYTLNNAPVLAPTILCPLPLYQPGGTLVSAQAASVLPSPLPMYAQTPLVAPMYVQQTAYPQPGIAAFALPSSKLAPIVAAPNAEEEEDEVDVDDLMALCGL